MIMITSLRMRSGVITAFQTFDRPCGWVPDEFLSRIYVCVDLENWNGTDRHHFNAIVSDQDLVEVTNKRAHPQTTNFDI